MQKNTVLSHFILLAGLFFFLACGREEMPPETTLDNQIEEPEEITTGTPPEEEVVVENDIWWNDRVFYEIFVRSFYDSDGDGVGDLQGIIEKLDYLNDGDPNTTSDLGITGLWLMPIFPSPSYHGYDVTNYRAINPDYGTMDDFRQLLTQAHARGIKVIIDFVGNHTSTQHPWFSASASGQSKRDWYLWEDRKPNYSGPWGQTVWHQRNNAYYYGLFWGGMPDLNFTNNEVTEEIKDISRFWMEDIGVDGFRIDAVKHWIEEESNQENTDSTLAWWRDYYIFQKQINPAFMTVGEVWTSTQNILPYSDNRLDYNFEFDLASSIIDAINSGSSNGLRNKMNQVSANYNPFQYGTFLANHDQDRVINRFSSSVAKSKLAASILLSLPGIPYLYYGEEIGMMGVKPDENIRRPMQWDDTSTAGFTTGTPWHSLNNNINMYNVRRLQTEENSIWNHYRKWIKMRQTEPALTQGRYKGVGASANTIFPYLRMGDAQSPTLLVIHNLSSRSQSDFSVNVITSDIPAGTYDLVNALDETVVGNLVVGSQGGFSTTFSGLTLPFFGSVCLRLQQ